MVLHVTHLRINYGEKSKWQWTTRGKDGSGTHRITSALKLWSLDFFLSCWLGISLWCCYYSHHRRELGTVVEERRIGGSSRTWQKPMSSTHVDGGYWKAGERKPLTSQILHGMVGTRTFHFRSPDNNRNIWRGSRKVRQKIRLFLTNLLPSVLWIWQTIWLKTS